MYKRQPLFARDLPRRVKTLESLFGRPEGVKTLESWLAEWRSMEAKRAGEGWNNTTPPPMVQNQRK